MLTEIYSWIQKTDGITLTVVLSVIIFILPLWCVLIMLLTDYLFSYIEKGDFCDAFHLNKQETDELKKILEKGNSPKLYNQLTRFLFLNQERFKRRHPILGIWFKEEISKILEIDMANSLNYEQIYGKQNIRDLTVFFTKNADLLQLDFFSNQIKLSDIEISDKPSLSVPLNDQYLQDPEENNTHSGVKQDMTGFPDTKFVESTFLEDSSNILSEFAFNTLCTIIKSNFSNKIFFYRILQNYFKSCLLNQPFDLDKCERALHLLPQIPFNRKTMIYHYNSLVDYCAGILRYEFYQIFKPTLKKQKGASLANEVSVGIPICEKVNETNNNNELKEENQPLNELIVD